MFWKKNSRSSEIRRSDPLSNATECKTDFKKHKKYDGWIA